MGASPTRQADGAAASAKFRFLLTHRRRSQGFCEPLGAEADAAPSLTMLWIPPGRFWMGSPEEEPGRSSAEGPQHLVQLQGFFLAQTPITQAQWRAVAQWRPTKGEGAWNQKLNPNPSRFKGDQRPVEQVSWEDAMEFCRRLSQRTGRRYTLPCEAQWEYACRAGTTTPFHSGDTISTGLANYNAWQTTDVASFPANPWALHDMHGNVWEWCLDVWHGDYNGAPTDGSAWEEGDSLGKCCAAGRGSASPRTAAQLSASATARSTATTSSVSASVASPDIFRLLRGGSWDDGPANCRSACRGSLHPDDRYDLIGFRVCCLPQD